MQLLKRITDNNYVHIINGVLIIITYITPHYIYIILSFWRLSKKYLRATVFIKELLLNVVQR